MNLHAATVMMSVGGTAVLLLMLSLWAFAVRRDNYGWVDVGWSFGLVLMAAAHAWFGPGLIMRKALIAGMVAFWGLRLGTHLWTRVASEPEDGRYRQLRKDWAHKNLKVTFLGFFLLQGVLDIFLSLPILLACLNPSESISALEWVGLALWVLALSGESIADAQLRTFKKDPRNKAQVCQAGLWNYSRHPNYFFEWLIWVAWALFALASPYGWTAIACPALMFLFLFRVTGIPATEDQSLRSRGEAYRQYQQTTSAFVPWFKKAKAS